jgi:predicted nucleic acid-binding protein
MKKLLADTNIFGIAVDRKDSRRKSVWKTLEKIASGKIELYVAKIVIDEIKKNPHKITMRKELELVNNLVTGILSLSPKAKLLAELLEKRTSLDVVDAQIVAIAIVNNLVFWSGDRKILRKTTISEIKKAIKEKNLSFRYKRE